ncbi:MAG: hypothetical protein IT463_11640, partial [Planctomycetes bacterium]|nr:hypothetical protein [Planctomycetota bacterium]
MATASKKPSVLDLDLPEIAGRSPYAPPTSHLVKAGADRWQEAEGRRGSHTMLVNQVRAAVDAWRNAGYPDISDTTRRLLGYWF